MDSSRPLFASFSPPPTLAPFVRRMLIAHNDTPIDQSVRPAPTGYSWIGWIYSGTAEMTLDGLGPTRVPHGLNFAGQIRSHEIEMRYSGRYGHLIAEMTATGFFELTHVPGIDICGRAGLFDPAHHPWAGTFAAGAPNLHDDASPQTRRDHFVAALEALVPAASRAPDHIREAARIIEAEHGLLRIGEVAERVGVGQRHLARSFTRIVGVPPKFFSLVMQMNRAIELWASGDSQSLTELSHAAGYYDQAHFNRALRAFFPSPPGDLLSEPEQVLFEFLGKPSDRR